MKLVRAAGRPTTIPVPACCRAVTTGARSASARRSGTPNFRSSDGHVTFDGADGNVHPARDLRIAEVRSDRFEDFRLTLRHGRRVSSPLAHCIPTAAMAIMLNNREFSRQGHFWRCTQSAPEDVRAAAGRAGHDRVDEGLLDLHQAGRVDDLARDAGVSSPVLAFST